MYRSGPLWLRVMPSLIGLTSTYNGPLASQPRSSCITIAATHHARVPGAPHVFLGVSILGLPSTCPLYAGGGAVDPAAVRQQPEAVAGGRSGSRWKQALLSFKNHEFALKGQLRVR